MEKSKKPRRKNKKAGLPSWLKRLAAAAVIILILTVAGTVLFFINYFRDVSSDVTIEIQGAEEVKRGVPFEIEVSIANRTDVLVTNVELAFTPPPSILNLGSSKPREITVDKIGDLGSGSLAKRTYRLLAIGEVGDEAEIVFSLSYSTSPRNQFETQAVKKVNIKGSAVALEVTAPAQILPGSAFEFEVKYENTSDFDLPEAVLELKYPTAFTFISASLTPDSLNNFWRLGEVRAHSSGRLTVRGSLQGADGDSFDLTAVLSARFLGEDFPVATKAIKLSTSPSPVRLGVLINRRSDYIARIGDRLTYIIRYENLSGVALSDVVIKAKLTGELFDFATLTANANVNRSAGTVSWDVSNLPALRLLEPNSAGEVSFEIKLKDRFPISRLNDKNFSLRAEIELTSPTVPYYLSAAETRAEARVETKVAGLVLVDTRTFYRDAISKIVNSGPMPPKVGQATQYTVHWLITNYATDLSEVTVRLTLAPNVRWTGIVKSNIDSVPLYEAETREVVWTIGKVKATRGVLDEPLAAVFQIEAVPTAADLGKFQELVSATVLTATDDFTGLNLTASDIAQSTLLPDDITIGQGGGRVGQ